MAGNFKENLSALSQGLTRGRRKAMRVKRAAGRLKRNFEKGKTGKAKQNANKLMRNSMQLGNQGRKTLAAAKNFR